MSFAPLAFCALLMQVAMGFGPDDPIVIVVPPKGIKPGVLDASALTKKLPTSAQIELPTPKTGSATWQGAERGDIIPPQAAKSRVCRCRLGLMAHPRQKPRGTSTKTTARLDNGGQTGGSLLASTDGSFLASAEG